MEDTKIVYSFILTKKLWLRAFWAGWIPFGPQLQKNFVAFEMKSNQTFRINANIWTKKTKERAIWIKVTGCQYISYCYYECVAANLNMNNTKSISGVQITVTGFLIQVVELLNFQLYVVLWNFRVTLQP